MRRFGPMNAINERIISEKTAQKSPNPHDHNLRQGD